MSNKISSFAEQYFFNRFKVNNSSTFFVNVVQNRSTVERGEKVCNQYDLEKQPEQSRHKCLVSGCKHK